MKLLCDYLGCDSNGNAGDMKFNVLLKIHQEANKAFAALIKNDDDDEESEEDSEEEKAPKPKNDETKAYYIEIKGDETFWLEMKGYETIGDLKAEIQKQHGFQVDEQRIVFAGKQAGDEQVIKDIVEDAGEVETSRIHMIMELDGGGKIY